ncbi:MAG: thiamine pyrophosphate-dependent enzyme [Bacteroidales bacterium]|nr:thiamine pyrophosphate-dependent enzyme [Bacteroidales bacterium]MDT8372808.1 thiamine pyrophosphate-dependent enzyme [Bacteroidales bacterium]
MQKLLLLGDEAIAQAALDAGMSGMYAYPGTPSTEIMEYIQASPRAAAEGVRREWSSNEKTAMEAALGMSYAGKRAMVAMKHVGLNVAADAFINSAVTGVNGGLVVVAADDPSMHSSQNEQDSRFYGRFAMVPVLEPRNQQEAYDMIFDAFDLSEKYKLPVLIRITTRLAHSRAAIERRDARTQNSSSLPSDPRQFVLLPAIARKQYRALTGLYEKLRTDSVLSGYNRFAKSDSRKTGIITCGIAYNYLLENLEQHHDDFPVLSLAAYPVNSDAVAELVESCGRVLVLEEGYPLIEEQLRGLLDRDVKVAGRLDGTVPRDGELNPAIVAAAMGMKKDSGKEVPAVVRQRLPSFCKGCGHADVFSALAEVMKGYGPGRVFSDIGCYTLGALPPFNMVNSCVDMGASVTMAVGAADAGLFPAVAFIGDSTFTHSGMTGLLDAVIKDSPITVIISDNSTTGMTGGQQSQATGRIESICLGLGVNPDHLRMIIPLRKNHEENMAVISEELNHHGLSVIIAMRECIQTASRNKKAAAAKKSQTA